jgi:cation transport regulator
MPYGSNSELPESIRSVLPVKAQDIYRGAYNGADSGTCRGREDREACCAAIAWAAVKRLFERGEGGQWRRKQICCREGECIKIQKEEIHDAILQLLNRQVGEDFFTTEPFERTVTKWDGVPLIFSSMEEGVKANHPNFQSFSSEIPVEELIKVSGAVVGMISQPRIDSVGHPKLMGQMVFTDAKAKEMYDSGLITDEIFQKTGPALKICNKLLDAGKLSHSTAFSCKSDKKGNLIPDPPLVPNHVLVFEETEGDQPKDRGAVILNKEENESDEDKHANEGKVISKPNQTKFKTAMDALWSLYKSMISSAEKGAKEDHPDPEDNDENLREKEKNMDEAMKKELDEKDTALKQKDEILKQKEQELEDLKKKVGELETEVAEFKKKQMDAAWETEKKRLKQGLLATPEDEDALKKLYFENTHAYINKAEYIGGTPDRKESGDKHANKGGGETPEQKRDRILKEKGHRVTPGTLHDTVR